MKSKQARKEFYKHLSNILLLFGLILLTPFGRLSERTLCDGVLSMGSLEQAVILSFLTAVGIVLIFLSLYVRWKKLK
jgi:hypothetical protein